MKVAVSGASGFIGQHVMAELSRRNVTVVGLSRSAPAHPANPIGANTSWVKMDVSAPPDNAYAEMGSPDVLLHLAWGGLPNYLSLHHFETELPQQYAFLSGLVRAGLPALVSAGSCFEYGMQSGPLAATQSTHPDNPYGFAKDSLRRQLQYLQVKHPFAMTWARLFYLYGEGQSETSLQPMLAKSVASAQAEFLMSGGEQLRDYMPVTEAARQLVDMALDPCERGTVNICSGEPISVRRLVEGWVADKGWQIALRFGALPYPSYEPLAFWGVPSVVSERDGRGGSDVRHSGDANNIRTR